MRPNRPKTYLWPFSSSHDLEVKGVLATIRALNSSLRTQLRCPWELAAGSVIDLMVDEDVE